MSNENQTVHAFAEAIVEWHRTRVNNCNTVIDNADADIKLVTGDDGQERVIEAGSKAAKWLRIGMSLALLQFTPCPVTINVPTDADDSEEDCDDE